MHVKYEMKWIFGWKTYGLEVKVIHLIKYHIFLFTALPFITFIDFICVLNCKKLKQCVILFGLRHYIQLVESLLCNIKPVI